MPYSKLIFDFTIIPLAAGGIVWTKVVMHFVTVVPLLAIVIALGSVAVAYWLSDGHHVTWALRAKRWLGKVTAAYRDWFALLRGRPFRAPVWRLLRPRIGQVAIEIIFVSGLLIFSEMLLSYTVKLEFMQRFGPTTVAYGFWSIVALVTLAPLVAIWRNCSALSMLLSEVWETRYLPRGVLESLFKSAVFLLMVAWIYVLLPEVPFARWGWLFIVAGATLIVARFSRELVYWHSHVHISMREALTDRFGLWMKVPALVGVTHIRNTARVEVTLPANAWAAGQTLAALGLSARQDCTVVAIERHGVLMNAPSSARVLCPGDKVLLEGLPEKIAMARERLQADRRDRFSRSNPRDRVGQTISP